MRDMLPASLSKLCNRLAAEQAKATTWLLCRELRDDYQKRLGDGETMDALESDIHARMLQAAHQQFRMSIVPAKPAPARPLHPSRRPY